VPSQPSPSLRSPSPPPDSRAPGVRAAPDLSAGPRAAQQPPGYAVLFMDGADERQGRSGLSHPEAMADAESFQRAGKTARVMHVLGTKSYEVDRYPPR
jgi:hypothetical protein